MTTGIDRAKAMLAHERMQAQVSFENDDLVGAAMHEGKAEGIAELLQELGHAVDPWKPRPDVAGQIRDLEEDVASCTCGLEVELEVAGVAS